MQLSIDQIIENYAICEDLKSKKTLSIPLNCLPSGIKEGDILNKNKKDNTFYVDIKKTKLRRNKMVNLQNKIFLKYSKNKSNGEQ